MGSFEMSLLVADQNISHPPCLLKQEKGTAESGEEWRMGKNIIS